MCFNTLVILLEKQTDVEMDIFLYPEHFIIFVLILEKKTVYARIF